MKHFYFITIALCVTLSVKESIAQLPTLQFSTITSQPLRYSDKNIFFSARGFENEHLDFSATEENSVIEGDTLPQHPEEVPTRKKTGPSYRDSTTYSIYGGLLNDDPIANHKYPWWVPAAGLFPGALVGWSLDKYILGVDYVNVGFNSWKHNIDTGWVWDEDRFGMNQFFHPYGGTIGFNAGRANGYNFYESIPYALGSSLIWEYFGETTPPSINDLVNTTLSGAFGGEILYRLSSNVLDDRKKGSERFFRELFAAVINPRRAFSRLTQGRLFRVSEEEVYQKEPLVITLTTGVHQNNNGTAVGTGPMGVTFGAHFSYGNPFEVRDRKPFDFFKLRGNFMFGFGRKILDNVIGYGILFGKNYQQKKLEVLAGGFQHFDYWDNNTFTVGTFGFGVGAIMRTPMVVNSSTMESAVHLAIVPLAAISDSNVDQGDKNLPYDERRHYNFAGGMQAKFENIIDLGWGSLSTNYFLYWLHNYVVAPGESPGSNIVGIFKPRLAILLYRNLSLGFEYLLYHRNGTFRDFPDIHALQSQDRISLFVNVENFGITD